MARREKRSRQTGTRQAGSYLLPRPRRRACKKTILPLEKVWVTPHPRRTASSFLFEVWVRSHPRRTSRKVSSLAAWVCSHPRRTVRKVSFLTVWVCSHPRRTSRKVSSLAVCGVRYVRFPLQNSAFSFFRSYLNKRKQTVFISDDSSDPSTLLHGVPQGSFLGPILFLLYTQPLSWMINRKFPTVNLPIIASCTIRYYANYLTV